jgi:predicted  nucleic acid-binding Zn-ribbon protein
MKASKSSQEKILALQSFDASIIQLQHKINSLPIISVIEEKTRSSAEIRDLLIAAQTEKSDIKHELSKSEVDVELVDSRIERDEKHLASGLGTPKELEKIQHELQSLLKRKAELEEIELEVMVRIEALDLRIENLAAEQKNIEEEVSLLVHERDAGLADLNSALAKTLDDRENLAKEIEPELLALYEKIRKTGDGFGAARLHAGQCEGCHLTLNSADLARIKTLSEDEVVRCEECRRILVRLG